MFAKGWADSNAWATRAIVSEILLTLTVIVIFTRWKRGYMDFALVQLMIIRIALVLFIFKQIADGAAGYTEEDPKNLSMSVYVIGFPALIIFPVNWKYCLLLSLPLMLVGQLMVFKEGYAKVGTNMASYRLP